MDAQLRDRLDKPFSDRATQDMVRQLKLKPGGVVVACTAEFCRISGSRWLTDAGAGATDGWRIASLVVDLDAGDAGFGGGTSQMEHRGAIYMTRRGYRFPQ